MNIAESTRKQEFLVLFQQYEQDIYRMILPQKKLTSKIETTIIDFLTTEEIVSILNNEPYEIIVYSKDKKKMN